MNRHLPVLCLALLSFGCKKTVTLTLQNVPPAIVIEGEVTNQAGPYFVRITRPVDFYADNNFPAVSGAVVLISDGLSVTDSLTEVSPGLYSTHHLQGYPGVDYRLAATVEGVTYQASSTMPAEVPLDSISFQSNSAFGRTQISAIANFRDPAGVKNYYRFVEFLNGTQLSKDLFVFDDRLSDGRYINYTLFNDSSYLHEGDQLQVDMYCIDSAVYNYFFQLFQSGGAGAFNTSASPANPGSNISNGAFGFFSAHTAASLSEYVP